MTSTEPTQEEPLDETNDGQEPVFDDDGNPITTPVHDAIDPNHPGLDDGDTQIEGTGPEGAIGDHPDDHPEDKQEREETERPDHP